MDFVSENDTRWWSQNVAYTGITSQTTFGYASIASNCFFSNHKFDENNEVVQKDKDRKDKKAKKKKKKDKKKNKGKVTF